MVLSQETPFMDYELMREIYERGKDIINSTYFRLSRENTQHGSISVYRHCVSVTYMCLQLADKYKIRVDRTSLVRGALLHDYFLYDWHEDAKWHHLHGFTHAKRAMKNAQHDFGLNKVEQNMISCHMFPLNLFHVPIYRESILLCIADKVCGTYETVKGRNKQQL